jgi:hypothetical protein
LNENGFFGSENNPLTIIPGLKTTLIFTFTKEYSGFVQLCMNGVAGTKVSLGFQEMLGKNDRIDYYYLRNGIQSYESFQFNSFQHVKLEVEFEAKNPTSPLEIYAFAINFVLFPLVIGENLNVPMNI